MENFKYKITLSAILSIAFLITGCKKFVEIPPPVTQLVNASVFDNDASATSAQTAIYQQMVSNSESYTLSENNGLLADELTSYSSDIGQIQYYTNSMTVSTGSFGPWNNAYNYIYQANAIIEGLGKYNGVSNAVKQQLTGESLFLRAFWYFYLTNCYGDIPLATTTDYTVNSKLSRSSKTVVYQQIIADLLNAQNLLNANYVDANSISATQERIRPTKWAAGALLARVYLYLGDLTHDQTNYAKAEAQASLVINNSNFYTLCGDPNNVFLANSSEAIWQLDIPQPSNNNTPDGQFFILTGAPGSENGVTISPQLLNSFETGDKRKTDWIGTYTDPGSPSTPYYYPYKYKVNQAASVSEYVMVLRLAEQYLIRAEARAQQGNSAAVVDLNSIRNRAGLANYTGATDKPSLLTAIIHERQVEFFAEWGHRWFDLIRTGNANSVMSVVTPEKGGTWAQDSHQLLYPLPQSNINLDHNLTQNPGY